MARELGAESLRYLPVDAVARAIGLDTSRLCRACITGHYPTPAGQRLYQIAVRPNNGAGSRGRTYERAAAAPV
jgi:amidophosphoribosyltransferase